ncbi:MAG: CobW family GTP-binding protein [Pseudomonadota bacterium]
MTPRHFTVIAGFLGTGKTTLVNRILSEAKGTRYAVLVNDFGAVNVDAGLIAEHDGQTMALTNGCICCSMSDGFTQTMLRLMSQPDAFDHVIVEASGVAEPGKIMDFARIDPELAPDAIVTLADAETLPDRLGDPRVGEIAARQVRQADLICLTRTDLATDGQRIEAEAALAALNPPAPRLTGRAADQPLAALLGTGLAPGQVTLPDPVAMPLHTTTLGPVAPIDRAAFGAWAGGLPATVLRGKGVVEISGEGPRLWQKVGARSELTPAPPGAVAGQIVLIGTAPIDAKAPFANR